MGSSIGAYRSFDTNKIFPLQYVYQNDLNPQLRFWANPELVRILNNQSKSNGQWEFSKKIRLLKSEVRSFEQGKDGKITIILTTFESQKYMS